MSNLWRLSETLRGLGDLKTKRHPKIKVLVPIEQIFECLERPLKIFLSIISDSCYSFNHYKLHFRYYKSEVIHTTTTTADIE